MKSHRPGSDSRPLLLTRPAYAICFFVLTLAPGPVFAQQSVSSAVDVALKRKGDIMLRDASLEDWILAIKQEWHVNIVGGGDLNNERVSGAFTDAALGEVLGTILFAHGYGYQQVGDSLIIMRQDELGTNNPQFEMAVIPLENVDPTEAEDVIRMVLSRAGIVKSVPSSNSLLVSDFPGNITRVRQQLEVLERNARDYGARHTAQAGPSVGPSAQPGQTTGPLAGVGKQVTQIFHTRFVAADALLECIEAVVEDDARVSLVKDENRLIVAGEVEAVKAVENLITEIDVPRAQVRITAILYDVNLETMEQFGFNWSHAAKARMHGGSPQTLFDLNSSLFPPVASTTAAAAEATAEGAEAAATSASPALGGLVTLSHLTHHLDVNTFIRALDQTDGARLLARPSIMAYDGKEAEIKIVSEIPVQQLTQTAQGGSIGTTEFREAGITLRVTAEVVPGRTVMLQLAPEFSLLAGFSDSGQPIIDKRQTRTVVQMDDGETLVIGGLLRRTEMETVRGIPGMMHWKYVGKFFRDHDTTVSDSELLIFIKTEIVSLGYCGEPREQMAGQVSADTLEQIPTATYAPFIPPCNDPHCPYHCPRTPYDHPPGPCTTCLTQDDQPYGPFKFAEEEIDYGAPQGTGPHTVPTIPLAPEMHPAPAQMHPAPTVVQPSPAATPPPAPAIQPPPTRAPPTSAPVQPPQPSVRRPAPPSNGNFQIPPPVIIDGPFDNSLAPGVRMAMRRLPPVSAHEQPAAVAREKHPRNAPFRR